MLIAFLIIKDLVILNNLIYEVAIVHLTGAIKTGAEKASS